MLVGYKYIYGFVKEHLPDNTPITIMSDQAPCIETAAREVFGPDGYVHMLCAWHLWETLIKKFRFKPNAKLQVLFYSAARREMDPNEFLERYGEEEAMVDAEQPGKRYLAERLGKWSTTEEECPYRRGIVSSAISETINAVVKKKGSNARTLLLKLLKTMIMWYNKARSCIFPENQRLTDYAKTIVTGYVNELVVSDGTIDPYHELSSDGVCRCMRSVDTGFPCLAEVDRAIKHSGNALGIANGLVDSVWHAETYRRAFDMDAEMVSPEREGIDQTSEQIVQLDMPRVISDGQSDIIAVIKWLLRNDAQWRKRIECLVDEATETIVIPPLSVINRENAKREERKKRTVKRPKKRKPKY